jgi:hypothetical protein
MPKLNAPKMITFLVSLVIVIVALVVAYVWKDQKTLTDNAALIAAIGWLVLAAGNLIKGV